jgi:lipopolysaccharide transport system ATP-binding protein
MSVAIRVEGLSKKYVLGSAGSGGGLRHAIEDAVKAPFRLLGGKKKPAAQSGEFWALRDVSFEIRRGEVVGIIGRNGAGKSTLLKTLSRITEPTEGRIGIKGRIASLLEVGTGFHPELTGRENIYLNGAILGMTRAEIRRKFDEIVEFAEVAKFLDTPVKRYSSGMYVRLAFAVAAHLEPEILVVDEVLAVGDAQFQQKCLGKMQEVSTQQGRTVLFVSHAMHSVRALCNTGILLDQGRVEKRGDIADVLAAYSGRTAATLAGEALATNRAAGVSLVAASVRQEGDDGTVLVNAHFELSRPVPNAGLGVHVETSGGFELCDLRPETTGLRFGDRSGTLNIEFELPGLASRLGAGTYVLGLSFHETNWKRCLERTAVGEFVVPAVDVYETGFPPKFEKDGAVVLPVRLRKSV